MARMEVEEAVLERVEESEMVEILVEVEREWRMMMLRRWWV